MKYLIKLFFLILMISAFYSCNDDNNFNPGKQTTEYAGNATTVIHYYDYDPYTGQDYFVEEKQFSFNVLVFAKKPLQTGNTVESNPFYLQINPNRTSSTSAEGDIDIISSMIFAVSTGYGLLQYWDLAYNGNQISGMLTDNHTAEAAAGNLIWAMDDIAGLKMLMPFPMANGTQLSGTLTATNISITISGQSKDTYRKFTCQINADIN